MPIIFPSPMIPLFSSSGLARHVTGPQGGGRVELQGDPGGRKGISMECEWKWKWNVNGMEVEWTWNISVVIQSCHQPWQAGKSANYGLGRSIF